MHRRMSATEARIHFGELMRHVVEKHEPVIVEHRGKPHVTVISVEEYERLLAVPEEREDWRELVRQARERARAAAARGSDSRGSGGIHLDAPSAKKDGIMETQ